MGSQRVTEVGRISTLVGGMSNAGRPVINQMKYNKELCQQ